MQKSPNITLSMIVKNEEKYLRGCLQSVRELVDEIVIVDTGSTDKTLEIAKEYNARIFHFEWVNDFSKARNFALSKSAGKWILYLDADERVAEDSIEKILELTSKEYENLLGVRCLVNSLDDRNGKPKLMKYPRLFMNSPEIKFTGRVHEQIEDSLLSNHYQIINSDIEIIHLGYNIETNGLKDKARRNLALLHEEYSSNNSSYYAFHLGNTYEILEDYENSVKYFNIALADPKLNNSYKSICSLHIADYFDSEVHDYEKAEQIALTGLKNEPSNPLLNLLAAQIYLKLGKIEEAISFCKQSLINNKNSNKHDNAALKVTMQPEKIFSYGLYLSLIAHNKDAYEYFMREAGPEYRSITELLFNDRQLSIPQINRVKRIINSDNINLFLLIFEMSTDKKAALEILANIKYMFPENPKLLITLGNLYIENNFLEDGIHLLKESLTLKQKDPSAVFYLISAFVRLNMISEIPEWLLFAEREFGHIPVFHKKFSILKQKLEAHIR